MISNKSPFIKGVYAFPISISRLLDKESKASFFDACIDKYQPISINTGKIEKLLDQANKEGCKVFEYDPNKIMVDVTGQEYAYLYYKIARDAEELENFYMVVNHMNS